jgi:peroxiredoxin
MIIQRMHGYGSTESGGRNMDQKEIMKDQLAIGVGDQVPHFRITAMDGRTIDYSTIWQSRNLVLVSVPAGTNASPALNHLQTLSLEDTALVVTREPVPGVVAPSVIIADRWGEVMHVATASDPDQLPDRDEITAWIEHVRQRCPECEGEVK